MHVKLISLEKILLQHVAPDEMHATWCSIIPCAECGKAILLLFRKSKLRKLYPAEANGYGPLLTVTALHESVAR